MDWSAFNHNGMVLFAMLLAYLAPTIIAWERKRKNLASVAAMNVLLGWTILGWILAFIWALSEPHSAVTN